MEENQRQSDDDDDDSIIFHIDSGLRCFFKHNISENT